MLKLDFKVENGEEQLLTEEGDQVMMNWEQGYMEEAIKKLNPRGNVLEIGFGMGFSASAIQTFKHVKSHTIIECNEIVFERAKAWRKKYPDKNIKLVFGRWEDKILYLNDKFDAIFMDDYPLNIKQESNNITKYTSLRRFYLFIDLVLQEHILNVGGKISGYLNENVGFKVSSDSEPFVEITCSTMDIMIPKHCRYRDLKEQKTTIPVIKLIKPYTFEEAQAHNLKQLRTNLKK